MFKLSEPKTSCMKKTILIIPVLILGTLLFSFGNNKQSGREYKLIQNHSATVFEQWVKDALNSHYQLAGGVTYVNGSYTQAVYK